MNKSYFAKRTLTGLLAATVAASTLLGSAINISAAPLSASTPVNNATYVNISAVDNAKVAESVFNAFDAAVKKNSASEMQAVLKKIAGLTPTQRVHLFLLMYKNYYKLHYLDANFPYFNVKAYINTYPEVANKYPNLSGNALYEAVLDDYLSDGIFEGKSSCTDFDPVVAILAHPEETLSALTLGITDQGSGLAAIFNSYVAAEGSTSTKQYRVSSDLLGMRYANALNAASDFNNIFLVKDGGVLTSTNSDSANKPDNNQEIDRPLVDIIPYFPGVLVNPTEDSIEQPEVMPEAPIAPSTPSTPSSPSVDPGYEPEGGGFGEEYVPINHLASKTPVKAYSLYSTNSADISDGKYNVSSTINGKTVSGTFDAGLYNQIAGENNDRKAKAKTTVILYMYGTDLETGSGGVTVSIGELLKKGYNLDDLNVVILTGATKEYKSSWMNSNSGDFKCSYYYLDPSALTEEQKENLKNASAMAGSDTYEGMGVINKDTLKLLGNYGQANFGDSSLLAGMIDMTTDLFSADRYMIVFNDHGAGVNGGIGSPEEGSENTGLTTINLAKIEEGIGSSKFISEGNTFDLIGFDACLMGGVEVAFNMSKYGKYMLGCEELECGSWDYSDFINRFATTTDTTLRNDIVAFARDCSEKHPASTDVIQSFAVFDLNKIGVTANQLDVVGQAFNKLFEDAGSEEAKTLKTDVYYAMRSAGARSYTNGAYDKTNLFEYVDMYDYMSKLRSAIEKVAEKDKWKDNEAVKSLISNCSTSIKDLLEPEYGGALEYVGIRYGNGEKLYDVDANVIPTVAGMNNNLSYEAIAKKLGDSTLWNKFKASYLCGTSIYMPYYSAEPTKGLDEDGDRILTYDARYAEYEWQNLIENYKQLVRNYVIYKNSDENISRLNRLKAALATTNESGHYNYEELFGTIESGTIKKSDSATEVATSYISIPINKEYINAKADVAGDSIDPFTDFTEVLDRMDVYVLMDQTLEVTGEDGSKHKETVDLVVGQVKLKNDSIIGGTESINIVLANYKAYEVFGSIKGGEATKVYKEYALAKYVDEQIAKLFPGNTDTSNMVMFEADMNKEGFDSVPIYTVYNSDGSNVKLVGIVKKADTGYALMTEDEYGGDSTIRFHQYVVGNDTEPYVYSADATNASWEYVEFNIQVVELGGNDIDNVRVDITLNVPLDGSEDGKATYVATPEHTYAEDKTTFVAKDKKAGDDNPDGGSPGDNPVMPATRSPEANTSEEQSVDEIEENPQSVEEPTVSEKPASPQPAEETPSETPEEVPDGTQEPNDNGDAIDNIINMPIAGIEANENEQNPSEDESADQVPPIESAPPVEPASQPTEAPVTTGEGEASSDNSGDSGDNNSNSGDTGSGDSSQDTGAGEGEAA